MDNKISNKRKSLITTNVIPNKSRKIVNTTASPKTNNKSSKPTDKTIKKQKPDDKYITFEEDRKPKNIYEDETELTDESEEYETDHSVKKINGNNSLYDSNNEESEIEETDSGRHLKVEEEGSSGAEIKGDAGASSDEETEINEKTNSNDEEANSDEELEINEEGGNSNKQIAVNEDANSDDELEIDEEANSDEELEINEEANSNEQIAVNEEANSDDELEIDEEANSDEELEINEEANSNEQIAVNEEANSDDELEIDEKGNSDDEFEDNEDTKVSADSDDEAKVNEDLDKEAEELDEQDEDKQNEIIDNKFKVENFSVLVRGFVHQEDIEELFQDCKIMYFDVFQTPRRAFVYFEDEKSREIALKKDGMKFKGKVIELERLIKSSTKLTVEVSDIDPAVSVYNIFPDSEIDYYKRDFRDIRKAVVHFKDKESVAKALSKNETKVNKCTITVKKYKKPGVIQETSVRIEGFHQNSKVLDIFDDCKIISFRIHKKFGFVTFADEESLEKALLKDNTEHDGCLIRVFRTDCIVVFEGAIPESKIEDVFDDCKIHTYHIFKNSNSNIYKGKIFINFQDIKSVKKALMKDRTECDGRIILVRQKAKFENKGPFTPKQLGGIKQTPFKKSFTPKNKHGFRQISFQKSSSFKEPNNFEQNQLLLKQIRSQILTLEREIYEKEKSIKNRKEIC